MSLKPIVKGGVMAVSHAWRLNLLTLLLGFVLVNGAWAGGLYLYEVGSPDVGLAGAGYAARAEDAATVFTNPAGMTRIDEPSLMMGAQPMYLHINSTPTAPPRRRPARCRGALPPTTVTAAAGCRRAGSTMCTR